MLMVVFHLSSYWWMELQKFLLLFLYSAYLFFWHQTVFQVFVGIWNFRVEAACAGCEEDYDKEFGELIIFPDCPFGM